MLNVAAGLACRFTALSQAESARGRVESRPSGDVRSRRAGRSRGRYPQRLLYEVPQALGRVLRAAHGRLHFLDVAIHATRSRVRRSGIHRSASPATPPALTGLRPLSSGESGQLLEGHAKKRWTIGFDLSIERFKADLRARVVRMAEAAYFFWKGSPRVVSVKPLNTRVFRTAPFCVSMMSFTVRGRRSLP